MNICIPTCKEKHAAIWQIMQNNDAKLETSLVLGIMAASLFKRTVSRDLQYTVQ